MTDHIDPIYIDETHRIRVEYDEDLAGRSPRVEWDTHLTAFVDCESGYPYSHRRVYPPTPLYDDPTIQPRTDLTGGGYRYYTDGMVEAVRRLYGLGSNMMVRAYVSNSATIERWARIFYGLTIEWDDEAHGFWVVSPDAWKKLQDEIPFPDLAGQAKVIAEERETYRQWADGNVYVVIAEEAVELYHKDRQGGDAMVYDHTDWSIVDSVGSIYCDAESYTDDEAGFRRVANDHFASEWTTKEVTVR